MFTFERGNVCFSLASVLLFRKSSHTFKSSKLFYNPYVNQLCKDTSLIKDVADIKYLFDKNLRPVTMISSYPTTKNKYFYETMEETLKKLTERVQWFVHTLFFPDETDPMFTPAAAAMG